MAKAKSSNLNEDILAFLRQDELDYPEGAKSFGAPAVPFLVELTNGSDEALATKAAYLLGYITDPAADAALVSIADNKFTTVRIAAAHGASKKDQGTAQAVLNKSIGDYDHGVVKVAMRSIGEKKLAKNFTNELKALQKKSLPDELKERAIKLAK